MLSLEPKSTLIFGEGTIASSITISIELLTKQWKVMVPLNFKLQTELKVYGQPSRDTSKYILASTIPIFSIFLTKLSGVENIGLLKTDWTFLFNSTHIITSELMLKIFWKTSSFAKKSLPLLLAKITFQSLMKSMRIHCSWIWQ